MGSLFLAWSLANVTLPPAPRRVLPPAKTQEEQQLEIKRRRQERARKIKPRPKTARFAPQKPEDIKFHILSQYVYPRVFTSGPRKRYVAEPTPHAALVWWQACEQRSRPLYVFRFAPFVGSGIYDNTAGRFGLSYLGIGLGIGRLKTHHLNAQRQKQALEARQLTSRLSKTHLRGWTLSLGLALQVRHGRVDSSTDPPPEDLDTSKGVTVDGFGLWSEFSYLLKLFGTLGVHGSVGFQQGRGKVFTYAGLGANFWH